MLLVDSVLSWKFLLLTIFAATYTVAAPRTTCGRDPSNIVSIRDNLAIAFCSDNTVRVVRGEKNAASLMAQRESLVIDPASATHQPFTDFVTDINDEGDIIAIKTREMLVEVNDISGQTFLSFRDKSGSHEFTCEVCCGTESEFSRSNEDTIQQSWTSSPDESIYGGGQFVNGFLDYKAAPIHLVQYNTEVAVPFFVSSRGYGILWDNYGETWLNPPKKTNFIPMNITGIRSDLFLDDPSRNPRRLNTLQENNQQIRRASGSFIPEHSGDYWFLVDMQGELGYSNSNSFIQLTIVEIPTVQGNEKLPKIISVCAMHEYNIPKVVNCRCTNMKSEMTYRVILEYDSNVMPMVFFTFIDGYGQTTLQSKDSEIIDYYLIVAPDTTAIDSIIASYRELTGSASLFSKKAYGFWQCKEHYHNQTELLDAAQKFRQLGIPVDNIVQDWHYWGTLGWGPQWDKSIYPDPGAMIQQLHKNHNLNFMVSVWSRFDNNTKFYKEMNAKGFLINDTDLFDAWNPEARKLFFHYLDDALFAIGADAVWLDATEPEGDAHLNKQIYLGSGNQYRNTFSLQVNRAFHEGFTKKYGSKKRPFALTRSSFAGQQRFASVVWSGDTLASFDCLRRQIAMSINYQISGDPYWTMDIGGFFRETYPDQYTSREYQMLLLRWFQFGVFVPIMRHHGQRTDTELWNYGNETQSLIVESAINLRYRLIPYIYSGFQRVQQTGYTMGRAMAFDFLDDRFARSISDQFMFGDSFLVAPVYNLESNRTFYLPSCNNKLSCAGSIWRDFYTGLTVHPGHYFAHKVDPASMLLFVRSSIVVLAPKSKHVHDPIALLSLEVRIYSGKDSSFILYEDDGVDPDPSRPSTEITFSWSEQTSTLCIGERHGKDYPKMPQSRDVHVVLVRQSHGVGVDEVYQADATVTYDGHKICVDLKKVHSDIKNEHEHENKYLYLIGGGGITKTSLEK